MLRSVSSGKLPETNRNDGRLGGQGLDKGDLYFEGVFVAVGPFIRSQIGACLQNPAGQLPVDGDLTQRRKPAAGGEDRSGMPQTMVVGPQNDDPIGHLDPREGLAGDRSGIEIAGVRGDQTDRFSFFNLGQNQSCDHLLQGIRFSRIKLAGYGRKSLHPNLPRRILLLAVDPTLRGRRPK